jgi:hypothetical protein
MNSVREIARPRRTLTLSVSPGADAGVALLRRAISAQTCVLATYNRGRVKLAPYRLYERDDALFLDAVTVERDGQAPREPKLGAFRLSGLSGICWTTDPFERSEAVLQESKHAERVLAQI